MLDLAERNHYLSFSCFHLIDDEIILSNIRGNGLFVLDNHDFHIKKLEPFIHIPYEVERFHLCSCVWKDTIYFCPDSNGTGIHKYNVVTGEQEYIETGSFTCSGVFPQDDGLILLPALGADGIWKLDFKTGKLCRIQWRDFQEGEVPCYIESGQMYGSKFWMVSVGSPYLFIVDAATGETQRKVIGDTGCQLLQCAYDGTYFWFIQLNDERMIRWTAESGEIRYYTLSAPDSKERFIYRDMWFLYKKIIAYEKQVFLVDGSGIFSIDSESGKTVRLALLPKETMKCAITNWYVKSTICGRKIVVCFCPTNLVAVIDVDTLKVKFYDTTIRNSTEFETYVQTLCDKKIEAALNDKIVMENEEPDVRRLDCLFTLVQHCDRGKELTMEGASIGEVIYKHVQI